MKRGNSFAGRLLQGLEQQEETVPLQSVLELCGDQRVLIENHFGVTEYCKERISVKVRFGTLTVSGCDLHLRKMHAEVLVITGKIDEIWVKRGNC